MTISTLIEEEEEGESLIEFNSFGSSRRRTSISPNALLAALKRTPTPKVKCL